MVKKCWICGREIRESAAGYTGKMGEPPFHTEIRLVVVNRPYAPSNRSKAVYVCQECTEKRIGMSGTGKNLNQEADEG